MATVDITLYLGDCLDILPILPAQSVDLIVTDLPYGTTACKWDVIIPFEPMWKEVKRILKPRGAFITTASQPFTSKLVMSNLEWFRDEIIWHKSRATRHLDANIRVMKIHENVIVFSDGLTTYIPQFRKGKIHGRGHKVYQPGPEVYGKFVGLPVKKSDEYYPNSVINFSNVIYGAIHPTQKPVILYEYLIKTYSNPDDTVMDFCMGSGTTGVACVQTGRNFIGCEMNEVYFNIANERIA